MTVIGIYPIPMITVIASNVSFHFNPDHVSSTFLPQEGERERGRGTRGKRDKESKKKRKKRQSDKVMVWGRAVQYLKWRESLWTDGAGREREEGSETWMERQTERERHVASELLSRRLKEAKEARGSETERHE